MNKAFAPLGLLFVVASIPPLVACSAANDASDPTAALADEGARPLTTGSTTSSGSGSASATTSASSPPNNCSTSNAGDTVDIHLGDDTHPDVAAATALMIEYAADGDLTTKRKLTYEKPTTCELYAYSLGYPLVEYSYFRKLVVVSDEIRAFVSDHDGKCPTTPRLVDASSCVSDPRAATGEVMFFDIDPGACGKGSCCTF